MILIERKLIQIEATHNTFHLRINQAGRFHKSGLCFEPFDCCECFRLTGINTNDLNVLLFLRRQDMEMLKEENTFDFQDGSPSTLKFRKAFARCELQVLSEQGKIHPVFVLIAIRVRRKPRQDLLLGVGFRGQHGQIVSHGVQGGYNRAMSFREFQDIKPRVALIGSGWYGKCDLFRLLQVAPNAEVVALCDVDKKMLSEATELVAGRQVSKKRPATFADYRELLKETKPELVVIGTPDHWHALQAIAAMEAGADVYCQKPISVDIAEGQAMLAAARKQKRVVQIGTQRRSTPHLVEAREILREGKLGKIGLVETCCYYHMRSSSRAANAAPPETLDWELWTGPAPLRPYNQVAHPRGWRAFMEYGNGIVGDMCVHMLDMTRWMLGLGWPKSVSSNGGIFMDKASIANITDTQTASFDFGETQVLWQHRSWGDAPDAKYPWSAIFYGEKGVLKASVNGYDFIPSRGLAVHKDVTMELDKFPEDATERDLEKSVAPAIRYHMADWLRAVQSRGRPVADIEEGHISTASCILANLAQQIGRTLAWDAQKGHIVSDDMANKLLRRPYRKPWVHPSG